MTKLRQSFSWWCFANRGVPADSLLADAKRIGYEAVELIDEELWPQARDHGMIISSAGGHGTIEQGLNRREHAARIRGELLENLERAVKWNIPMLICFSGNRGELDDETGLAICAETLSTIVPAAEKVGVVLAMELLNSRVDHRDYQCDRTHWGVRLCRQLDSPAFKLLYDVYHMQIMEGDVIRTIQENHSFFAHYHTAGNPGRGPMDDTQELFYPAIYRAIAATNHAGFVGHEFIPRGDPCEELRAAFRQCADSF